MSVDDAIRAAADQMRAEVEATRRTLYAEVEREKKNLAAECSLLEHQRQSVRKAVVWAGSAIGFALISGTLSIVQIIMHWSR